MYAFMILVETLYNIDLNEVDMPEKVIRRRGR